MGWVLGYFDSHRTPLTHRSRPDQGQERPPQALMHFTPLAGSACRRLVCGLFEFFCYPELCTDFASFENHRNTDDSLYHFHSGPHFRSLPLISASCVLREYERFCHANTI